MPIQIKRIGFIAGLAAAAFVAAAGFRCQSGPAPAAFCDGTPRWSEHVFGPFSTQANHGYENANNISPVLPASYHALIAPQRVGVQFVGDKISDLQADHFSLLIKNAAGHTRFVPLHYTATDFVGDRLAHPLKPGTYQVSFVAPNFSEPLSQWTMVVKPDAWAKKALQQAHQHYTPQWLEALNGYRRLEKEPAVQWNWRLAAAAQSHSDYLKHNGYYAPSFHKEAPQYADYTGKSPWRRDLAFGWPTPLDGEVGIEWNRYIAPVTVMQDLIDTVYHRLSLLSDNLIAAGAGDSQGKTGAFVMDLAYGYQDKLPQAVVYPVNGQTGVATGWLDLESPNPVAKGFNQEFGYPITVDIPTAHQLSDIKFTVKNHHRRLAGVVDLPGVNGMPANQSGFVPKKILAGHTVYHVRFSAQVTYDNGRKAPLVLQWKFATGGTDQSVAVAPMQTSVVVSVVKSGSGIPYRKETVRIYKVQTGRDPV
ncbi:MAG: CAP domain-containing protein, partial [Firmicutes bacterium]|nr:CAP domain-containing protein [Bacillota bacterium]